MSEPASDRNIKLINLTEVWPVYAEQTAWESFNNRPYKLTSVESETITLNAAEINLMRDADSSYAATRIYTRHSGDIFVKESRDEIQRMVAETPGP